MCINTKYSFIDSLQIVIFQSPLFIRAHSKEILRSSLHNDTLFLSNKNVMDYSLLVGIDEERHELVVGIVGKLKIYNIYLTFDGYNLTNAQILFEHLPGIKSWKVG